MKKLLGILVFISIALSANAQLLWKVSGKGLEKPSYIFGTYHLSPLSIKDSIAAMPQAMNETTQVYGEVVMSEMATPTFMQSMQQQMMMPKDTTLQSLFTPEQYEEVGKVVKENMMVDIAMLAQLKPAAINQQLVVLLYMKHTPGFNPQEQLDTYFQQQAGQQDENVSGLEHNRTRRRGDLNFYKVSKDENDCRHYADHHNVVQAEQRFFLSIGVFHNKSTLFLRG